MSLNPKISTGSYANSLTSDLAIISHHITLKSEDGRFVGYPVQFSPDI
jgi:hypothetical protein